jgi:hypothetical protein
VRRNESLQAWFDWLRSTREAHRAGAALSPRIQADGVALHRDG